MFLGNYSPVAVGDYAAGPVARAAHRRHGPLRQRAVGQRFSAQPQRDCTLRARVWPRWPTTCARMADKEGLTAHRASVDVRMANRRTARRCGCVPLELIPWTAHANVLESTDRSCPTSVPKSSDGRLRAGRAAAGRQVHQAQHQRESVSAVAGRAAGDCRGARARAGEVSRSDGRRPFAAGPAKCWASSPTGSSAATAATTS